MIMAIVFRKELMMNRLIIEGRKDLVDDKALEIMDNLDGCAATKSCWRRVVHNEPVMWVVGKDGNGEYVNEKDCEWED